MRRRSSYYKWKSLPGGGGGGGPMTTVSQYCKAFGKVSLPPLGDYPSPLKDLFTDSNTATFETTSGSTTVVLHLNWFVLWDY